MVNYSAYFNCVFSKGEFHHPLVPSISAGTIPVILSLWSVHKGHKSLGWEVQECPHKVIQIPLKVSVRVVTLH